MIKVQMKSVNRVMLETSWTKQCAHVHNIIKNTTDFFCYANSKDQLGNLHP